MKKLLVIYILLSFIGYINAQVVENPFFDRCDESSFRVQKVEITKDTTYISCSYIAEHESWANISKETYLYDRKTNKKFPLLRCEGLPFSPQQKSVMSAERCDVLLYFPSLRNISKFDLIEIENKKAFNIYGIDTYHSYDTSYKESDVSRFYNMSSFYQSSGDTIKALQFKTKEIEAAKYVFGIKSEPLIVSLLNASIMYDKYGLSEQAIDIAKQKGVIHAELWGTSDWNYALHLRTLGSFYSHAKDYDNAIKKYEESIQLFDSLHIVDNEYALTLYFIADDYYEIGDCENALLFQKKSLEARRHIGESDGYINELYNVLLSGHNQATLERVQIVKRELNALPSFVDPNSLPIARVYKEIASICSLMDDNDNAIEYCNKAISIMKVTGNNNDENYAELLGLRCKYQRRNGLKTEAISFGEAAKQLYDSLNVKSLKYADLLDDLSWAYSQDLNYEKAIQIQKSAIAIYRNAQDWISLADAYDSMSNYYQWAEKLDEAENSIKETIEILNEYNKVEQTHGAITGNSDNASNTLTANKDISMSNLYQTLAFIYQKQGKYTDAINAELERGKYIKNTMSDDLLGPLGELSYATHLMNLSTYYWKNNKLSDAIVYAEQCMKIFADNPSINSSQSKLQYSLMLTQVGDTTKAFIYAEMAVSESKLFNDLKTHSQALYWISYLYYEKRDYYRAEQCMADELNYLKKHISSELTEMSNEQKQRLWNQYEHFFLLYRSIIEKSDRNEDLLSKLYDYTLFSKNLLLDSEAQRNSIKESRLNVQWTDIQQQLSDDAIAIEFIATRESDENNFITYHALVIDKKHPSPRMITLYSESDLEEIKKTDLRNICDIVGELIWKPILTQYVTVKDIYFSPDGILHMLPIEYYSSDGTNCMSEHYNMYRLSSTKELIREMTKLHPNSVVLYGGLDYDRLKEGASGNETSEMSSMWRGLAVRGGFDPLYNTALETQEIKDLLTGKKIPTTLYSGVTGTEESFRNLSGQSHGIIHLATHGMYVNSDNVDIKKNENNFDFLESMASLNDPVKEDVTLTHSFLVMAGGNRVISRIPVTDKNKDGILTSKEISQLDLRGVDLVVLSACESALGDIDNGGVYGLQRGFKKAGANTILMSLDKVDDEATRILMVEFYRNLMSGKTKRQSLQESQQYLRKVENGKYDDPKYWASFIMLDGID